MDFGVQERALQESGFFQTEFSLKEASPITNPMEMESGTSPMVIHALESSLKRKKKMKMRKK